MRIIKALVISSALLLSACVKERIIERQAPTDIRESFNVEKLCEKTNCLRMKKASLGKIFLLMSSGRSTGSTPQWTDLKPQLVSFERSGDQVALLEENYQSVYEEISARELVQSFEIVAEDEESVTFNWGHGPKTLVFESPYDVAGPDRDPQEEEGDLATANRQYYPVVDAYTQNVGVIDGKLQINQIIKIRYQDDKKGNIDESLNMNFQLIPYDPPANFEKKEADPRRHVGFFVTKVTKKGYSKSQTSLINHWDLEKPITVAISKSVPDQYVSAITEGALYWNKVFGKEVIKVQPGIDPSSAPMERTIIVRWVPWLDAGAAYAIAQADPLTGEILRGQVFLPTIFTRVGSADLVASNGGAPTLMAKLAVRCDLTQRLVKINALAREADDSKRLKLAQDSVRSTVAHELGHALGMRHNFAGSFSAKVSAKEIYESIKNYFKDPSHQGLETTTSIMDYVTGIDDILMSARLKTAPLSYDKMAMDYVYKGTPTSQKTSFFCTDEDISLAAQNGVQIYGCARFDAGNNPLYRAYLDARDEKENLVKVLFTSIVGRRYPGDQPSVVRDLSQVINESKAWSQANLQALKLTSEALFDIKVGKKSMTRFVSLQKHLESPEGGQAEGEDTYLDAVLKNHIAEAGGLERMIKDLTFDVSGKLDTTWFDRQLQDLEKAGFYKEGKNLSGRDYKLSDQDIEMIRKYYQNAVDSNTYVAQAYAANFLFPQKDLTTDKGQVYSLALKSSLQAASSMSASFFESWFAVSNEKFDIEIDGKVYSLSIGELPVDMQQKALAFADSLLVGTSASNQAKSSLEAVFVKNLDLNFTELGATPVADKSAAAYAQQLADIEAQMSLPEELSQYLKLQIQSLKSVQGLK